MNSWSSLLFPMLILAFAVLAFGISKAVHEEGHRQGYNRWILNWMFGHPWEPLVVGVLIVMALLLGWGAP